MLSHRIGLILVTPFVVVIAWAMHFRLMPKGRSWWRDTCDALRDSWREGPEESLRG